MKAIPVKFFVVTVLLLGLPLLGPSLTRKPLGHYFEFPPRSVYIQHAPFSWVAFCAYTVFVLGVTIPFIIRAFRRHTQMDSCPRQRFPFPWWGYLGISFGVIAWVLAWTRFSWFEKLQPHTFTPLWIAYIVTINALSYQRTGRCMLIDHTSKFLVLFPVSALFWWFFEYLNRFVQNWQYMGPDFGPQGYFCFATMSFSTVLPAVSGTRQWLMSFAWFQDTYSNFAPFSPTQPKALAFGVLALACTGLACIGILPNLLFPLLWISPLLLLVCIQACLGERTIFSSISHGDWHPVLMASLSALICGLFWEMWNYYSLAKWIYHVPYVGRFKVFEMPALGYAGYLPFGLECAVIVDMILSAPVSAAPLSRKIH